MIMTLLWEYKDREMNKPSHNVYVKGEWEKPETLRLSEEYQVEQLPLYDTKVTEMTKYFRENRICILV